jgi:sterol desaturase/sphingolipid hydroxylase (fatty acid hydroxylase superfamily)
MSPSQIIVLAIPVFILLIVAELAYGVRKGRNTYRLADAINSISLGMLSQISAVFTRLLRVGLYTAVYASVSLVPLEEARAFWTTWQGWLLALVFYDFCYYWLHRMGHEVAVLWAAHVVHHQSQDYNLSTALRQTSSGALLGWIFYLPMAIAGVPPLVFGIVALVDLLYQYWVHTEHVPKLGWFDRWFCSPSNHRVHHAVNDNYLDKNYGGILILWDRLFGTFRDEDLAEPCVYGTRGALNSWDPLWANAEVYWALAKDSLAHPQLGRQIARLAQAAGLAAGRRGAALSEAAFRHGQGTDVRTGDQSHGGLVCRPEFHGAAGRRDRVSLARRPPATGAGRAVVLGADGRPVGGRRGDARPHQGARSPADPGCRTGHRHQRRRTAGPVPGDQTFADADCYLPGSNL